MIYYYFLKRFLLIFPTLFVILLLNFLIIQTAPGGPVERLLSQINHNKISGEISESKINNFDVRNFSQDSSSFKYQGSQGVDADLIKQKLWLRFTSSSKIFFNAKKIFSF